jgi:cell wall-associated NlpC family hydrolase
MKQFGYTIGRTCSAQYYNGSYVSRNNLLPGDIVLFERTYASSGLTHAGLYIGKD